MKSAFLCLFCFISTFCFSQQTEEFKLVKNYYNQHRSMLGTEFKKKFDAETNNLSKASIRQDFLFFMKKMDSIENAALVGALLKVKNIEDLSNLKLQTNKKPFTDNSEIFPATEKNADYPGGINALRQEVATIFYTEAVYSETNPVKTNVAFVVEKDGTISNVKAEGDNFTFNRQAEIALYSVSKKFTPAVTKGNPVRYRFRLPLTLNID